DPLGRLPRHGDADRAGVVEHDGVAVHDLERLHGIAAGVADHRVLADAFEVGLRPQRVAGRAARRDVGVAEAEALRRGVVTGRGRGRGDSDVADADRDAVAGLGAVDVNGPGDLVAAAQA